MALVNTSLHPHSTHKTTHTRALLLSPHWFCRLSSLSGYLLRSLHPACLIWSSSAQGRAGRIPTRKNEAQQNERTACSFIASANWEASGDRGQLSPFMIAKRTQGQMHFPWELPLAEELGSGQLAPRKGSWRIYMLSTCWVNIPLSPRPGISHTKQISQEREAQ